MENIEKVEALNKEITTKRVLFFAALEIMKNFKFNVPTSDPYSDLNPTFNPIKTLIGG
jgi:hypothetical protein